jgi:hypothetical protein
VPIAGSTRVRARPIDQWGQGIPIEAMWTSTDDGYAIEVRIDGIANVGDGLIELDVIVNEKPSGRERRRGQLVLSGGEGEFIYLRGDRHEATHLIPFLLTDA